MVRLDFEPDVLHPKGTDEGDASDGDEICSTPRPPQFFFILWTSPYNPSTKFSTRLACPGQCSALDWLVHPIIKASSPLTLALNKPPKTHLPRGSMMDDKGDPLGDRLLGQKHFEWSGRPWEVWGVLLNFTVGK